MKKTILALALLAPAAALAQARGYGTAGCGLGALVFGAQPGGIQILAATTNGTLGNQTFAITSGTSNCGKSLFALEGTKVFIEGNREALAKDAARGSGDTIVALRNIASCSAPSAEVGSALQRNFGTLFPSATAPAEQVRDNVVRFLRTEKTLGCDIG
jgi:hypothetical protein